MVAGELSRRLVGASLPRSGHHHLERLLGLALGDRFGYCEFYVPSGCCGQVPCTRAEPPVRFQKHHDFDGTLARDLPGVHYVVQHREPVGAAVSDRELYVRRHNPALVDDAGDHEHWLALQALQHVAFVAKWVLRPPAASTVIDYADLVADPAGVVLRLLADAGVRIADPGTDVDAGSDAVRAAVLAGVDDAGHDGHHRSGDPLDRPGYDAVLLPRFESLVVAELAGARGGERPRRLAPAEWSDTPMGVLLRAIVAERRGDPITAAARLDAALAASPDHAGLLRQRGHVARVLGELDAAASLLRRADAAGPGNPPLLLELAACLGPSGRRVEAAALVEAVVALRPDVPDHRVELADRRAQLGQVAEARAAIDAALAIAASPDRWAPFPPAMWGRLVAVAQRLGDDEPVASVRQAEREHGPERGAG